MSNNIKYTLSILFCSIMAITSCKKDDKTFGDLTSPDKPVIDVQVVGKTTAAPYGDSTGKIIVTVTSANAINYKVNFNFYSLTISIKYLFKCTDWFTGA